MARNINSLRSLIKKVDNKINAVSASSDTVVVANKVNEVSSSLFNLSGALDGRFANKTNVYTRNEIDGKGFLNNLQVDNLVTGKGYLNNLGVNNLLDTKGFLDTTGVNGLVDGKGFRTAVQVANDIASNANITNLNSFKDGIVNGTNIPTALSNRFADITNVYSKIQVDNKGFLDSAGVDTLVGTKGFLNSAGVDSLIGTKGFLNNIQVNSLVDGKGFRTAEQVASDIATNANITSFNSFKTGIENGTSIPTSLTNKFADASTVYTKAQVDTNLGLKADSANVYTKTQVDTNLGLKADSANVYTKNQVDTSLGLKVDSANVYTKTQVDTSLGLKADSANVYTKTQVDTNFRTPAQVQSDIGAFNFSAGANTSFNNALNAKANTTDVNSALSAKANTTDVNSALSAKANTTDLASKADKNYVDTNFRTPAQVQSDIGAFDFSSNANPTFNARLSPTETRVTNIGLSGYSGAPSSNFGPTLFSSLSGYNFWFATSKNFITLATSSYYTNAPTDIPEFSLGLERSSVYINSYWLTQTKVDTQKFITYDLNWQDSRGDLTLNAGNVIIKGNDLLGTHYAQFTNNRGTLVGGSNNGGAVYFGLPVGDSGNGYLATAGIETSWSDVSLPTIGIGVTRDGSRASVVMDYNQNIKLKTGNTDRLLVNSSGYVGIGTQAPGYPLQVDGYTTIHTAYAYLNAASTVSTTTGDWTYVTIRANNRIMATEFNAVSDLRNKQIYFDPQENIKQKYKSINIVNYKQKNEVLFNKTIGVIAQDLENIFPDAVTKVEEFVADIFSLAASVTKIDEKKYLVAMNKLHGLSLNDEIKIYYKQESSYKEKHLFVNEIIDEKQFKVESEDDITNECLVYGKKVNDSRLVNYQYINSLTVKIVQELMDENDLLNAKLAEKDSQIADIVARLNALENKN